MICAVCCAVGPCALDRRRPTPHCDTTSCHCWTDLCRVLWGPVLGTGGGKHHTATLHPATAVCSRAPYYAWSYHRLLCLILTLLINPNDLIIIHFHKSRKRSKGWGEGGGGEKLRRRGHQQQLLLWQCEGRETEGGELVTRKRGHQQQLLLWQCEGKENEGELVTTKRGRRGRRQQLL